MQHELCKIAEVPAKNSRLVQFFGREVHVYRIANQVRAVANVCLSLTMRKLAAFPREDSLALALREIGRIERTPFTLEWLQEFPLRSRREWN